MSRQTRRERSRRPINLQVIGTQLILPRNYRLGWKVSSPRLQCSRSNGTQIVKLPQTFEGIDSEHAECKFLPRGAWELVAAQLLMDNQCHNLEFLTPPAPFAVGINGTTHLSLAESRLVDFLATNLHGVIHVATRDDIGKLIHAIYRSAPETKCTVTAHQNRTIEQVQHSIRRHAFCLKPDPPFMDDEPRPVPLLSVGTYSQVLEDSPNRPLMLYVQPNDIQIGQNEFFFTCAGNSRQFAIICDDEPLCESDEQYLRINFGFADHYFAGQDTIRYEIRTRWIEMTHSPTDIADSFDAAVIREALDSMQPTANPQREPTAETRTLVIVQDLQQALVYLRHLPNYRLLRQFPDFSILPAAQREEVSEFESRDFSHAIVTPQRLNVINWRSFDRVIRADNGNGISPLPVAYRPDNLQDLRRLVVVDFLRQGRGLAKREASRRRAYDLAGFWPLDTSKSSYFVLKMLRKLRS